MAATESRELEHPHDVYPDARKLCLGGELGWETRVGRMEHVGNISGDRLFTRVFIGDGHLI